MPVGREGETPRTRLLPAFPPHQRAQHPATALEAGSVGTWSKRRGNCHFYHFNL